MVDVRGFNGGMNTDAAPELLPAGDYIYAMNVTNGPDGITNLLGNSLLSGAPPPANGSEWICGAHFDKTRQRIIYFTFNATQNHRIIVVDVATEVHTVLFEDRADTGGGTILNWGTDSQYNPNKIIKDIKVVYKDNGGDLVYFIDPLKRPLKFNTTTLPTLSAANDVLFDYFKVIKAPPTRQPICQYFNAAGRNVNNLRKKLFEFKSRFVYDDDEKSVWSAVSKVPLPPVAIDDAYYADGTKANGIYVSVQTGDKNIKKIEVAARVNIDSEWSDYFLVETITKSISGLTNNTLYTYEFFNDGSYIPIDIEEGNLLFDYVPDEANALELANGSTLVFGGIKEGLQRLSNFNVSVSLSQSLVNSITGNVTTTAYTNQFKETNNVDEYYSLSYKLDLTGNVATGDTFSLEFNIINRNTGFPVVEPIFNYTATSGQNLLDVANSIVSGINGTSTNVGATVQSSSNLSVTIIFNIIGSSNGFASYPGDPTLGLDIIYNAAAPTSGSPNDTISCLKWLGRYKYGIAYYSSDGKTNGVFIGDNKNMTIDIAQYSQDAFQIPYITKVQFSINHAPPSWANHYHFVRTKELTSSFSKFFITKPNNDISEIANTFPYIYINIQNITLHGTEFPVSSTIINYSSTSFVKGDRIRFIKNQTTNTVFATHEDYEILGVVQRSSQTYIKVNYLAGMTYLSNASHSFLIEIFRPSPIITQDVENVYYEFGEGHEIITDSNGNLVHAGVTQNQIIGTGAQPAIVSTSEGDYYARKRKLITNAATNITQYVCMDENFSDTFESAVWSQGRPLVIDESAKSQYFPALLRFSNSYLQGSNINNLNRFYPENQEEADNSFGDILRLKTRENFIRMFQRYKTAMIPIYRSIIVDNATSTQVALSEKLLNKPNYYAGEYGIDKYGSSLISTDYGDYFIDSLNKAIVRVSLDGVTNISDTYNMATWANENININSYGYGCFNYENRNVVMLIGSIDPDTSIITNNIIAYSEADKNFESFYGFTKANAMLFINGLIYTLYVDPTAQVNQGWHLYKHDNIVRNNFYGEQQSSSIHTYFNGNFQLKKTYVAIEELANGLWTGFLATGPLTNQLTSIETNDFQKVAGSVTYNAMENKFNATIKRATNKPGGKFFGESMKGLFARVELNNSSSTSQRLISVSLKYIQSPLTNM